MSKGAEAFAKNVQHYKEKLAAADFDKVGTILELERHPDGLVIPFYGQPYLATHTGIKTMEGNDPEYVAGIVLSQFVLRCPGYRKEEPEWTAFKDFKKDSHFTNTNFFDSDSEKAMEKHFVGRLDDLKAACEKMNGQPHDIGAAYDVSQVFDALPHMPMLLLFNDGDDEFPPKCSVLYPKHAEHYLDPESLAIVAVSLVKKLKTLAG